MSNVKIQTQELVYWKVKRPAGKLFRKIVWKLPKKVVYWCVIRAAVAVEPDKKPSSVTAEEMLEVMKND